MVRRLYCTLSLIVGLFFFGALTFIDVKSYYAYGLIEGVLHYLTYFTVIACCVYIFYLYNVLSGKGVSLTFFGAVLFYQSIMLLFFVGLLTDNWVLHGFHRIIVYGVHILLPLLVIGEYIIFSEKGKIGLKDLAQWMILPIIYSILVTVIGVLTGRYPYFFMDLKSFSFYNNLYQMLGVFALYLLVGCCIILVDKILGRTEKK